MFAKIFRRQQLAGDTETDHAKERKTKIDDARLASGQLIADLLTLIPATDKSFRDERQPALNVSGKPVSVTETFAGPGFKLTKMDRQNTDTSVSNDTVINRHWRGLKFRKDLDDAVLPGPFWEIDVRESGVMLLSAGRDYDAQAKLKFIFLRHLEPLIKDYPGVYDFGVNDLSMRRGGVPMQFGLREREDLVEVYLPTSLVLAAEDVRDYIYEQMSGGELPDSFPEDDFDMTSQAS